MTARAKAGSKQKQTDVAEHLFTSRQRVYQLVSDGILPAPEAGGDYNLKACRKAYIEWLQGEHRDQTRAAADGRVRDARAREIELRIAEKERTLCHVDEALAFVDGALGEMKSDLLGLPANCTRDPAVRATIEAAVDGILTRAADRARDRGRALREGRAQ